MKNIKRLIAVILTILVVLPINVYAEQVKMNLKQALAKEGIELANKDYKENSDQVVIYLFRMDGCAHCKEFLEFLNTLTETYGDKFKLVSYEATGNYGNDNVLLFKEVSTFLDGKAASGFPYIVIGNKSFGGYSSALNNQIVSQIETEYKKAKNKRYDVMKKMKEKPNYKKPIAAGTFAFGVLVLVARYFATKDNEEE